MARMIDVESRVSELLGRRFRDGNYVTVKEKRLLCGVLCIVTVEMQCPRLHQSLTEWLDAGIKKACERVRDEAAGVC